MQLGGIHPQHHTCVCVAKGKGTLQGGGRKTSALRVRIGARVRTGARIRVSGRARINPVALETAK